jgi:ribosomal protein L34E
MSHKCPYCGKDDCLPSVVFTYAEHYGGSLSYPRCIHCDKILEVISERTVKILKISKTNKTESSW